MNWLMTSFAAAIVLVLSQPLNAMPPAEFARSLGRPAGTRGAAFILDRLDYEPFARTPPRIVVALEPIQQNLGAMTFLHMHQGKWLCVQIELTHAGLPITERYEQQLRNIFDYFDRDGDGLLNDYEWELAIAPTGMIGLLRGNFWELSEPFIPLSRLDEDRDRHISFVEYRNYVRDSFLQLAHPDQGYPFGNPPHEAERTVSSQFLKMLDSNRDGKLTPQELANAEQLIQKYDKNEDELLSFEEISQASIAVTRTAAAGMDAMAESMQAKEVQNQQGTIKLVNPSKPEATVPMLKSGCATVPELIHWMVRFCDKNKDGKFSIDEFPFDQTSFQALDQDQDGFVTAEELAVQTDKIIILKFTVDLAQQQPVLRKATNIGSAEPEIRYETPNYMIANFQEETIVMHSQTGPTQLFEEQLNAFLNQIFQDKPQIAEDELTPQLVHVGMLFDTLDRNADGIVTREEMTAYYRLQYETMKLGMKFTSSFQPPPLAELIDLNQDRRLSRSELRQASLYLQALNPPQTNDLRPGAFRPALSIRLTPASYEAGQRLPWTAIEQSYKPQTMVKPEAPTWFLKMDRNADGELTPLEFLGTRAQFEALDLNKDGIISASEAKQAQNANEGKQQPNHR